MSELDLFISELSALRLPATFNPYRDACPIHDKPRAPAIRRDNLRAVLEAGLKNRTRSMWIGRDLGYRGGRRTGIPLTDELCLPLLGARLGIENLAKSTRTSDVKEATATAVWNMVSALSEVPVFWNAFPFHPHKLDQPESNRTHTRAEAQVTEHLLVELISIFKPVRIVALGNDAQRVLERLGFSSLQARHPSYGGPATFRADIRRAYR